MSRTGRTVLLPRSPARGAGLAALLRDDGATVDVAPVIERAPAADSGALARAAREVAAGRYAWTVITSVNAVDALVAADPDVTLTDAPVRWAAVGPATVRALAEHDIAVDLVPSTESSAAGLVDAFRELSGRGTRRQVTDPDSSPGRVLLPLGDLATRTLQDGLAALGYAPDVVTAYRTVARELPDAVRHREYDAVIVTSGSVAREIAAQYGTHAPVVAIGRPSAEVARSVGLTVAAVADQPTDEALAAAVRSTLNPEDA